MELISKKMPANYSIIDTGDWHLGPLNCNINGIHKMLDYVKRNKTVYLILKGDLIDAISPNDKRYAHCSMSNMDLLTAQQQADAVIELLEPVKDRILLVELGNHEFKHINDINWGQYYAENLGCPYGGYSAKFIHLDRTGKPRWKGFFTHGYGSINSLAKDTIQRQANIKAGLKRKLEATGHTDCIYMSMGHTHKLISIDPTIVEEVMLTDDGENINQEYRVYQDQTKSYIPPEARWFGCSGSFLNLYSPPGSGSVSYGEMAMYAPVEHGYLELTIEGHALVKVDKVVC